MTVLQTQPNPIQQLQPLGQSVWLDYIRRCSLTSGELAELIDFGVQGVTSNPAIFQKAIAGSKDYDTAIASLESQRDQDISALYEQLVIEDIQNAADLLYPTYEKTRFRDGYVSLEVSPYLANDTEGSVAEARSLWQRVNRPNVMIKIPATSAGILAIQQLISEGINVNVTLLFSRAAYRQVTEAYVAGLEAYSGPAIERIASVASFFISRIDTAVDLELDALMREASQLGQTKILSLLQGLKGNIAIANAKLAYRHYQVLCQSSRWEALSKKGAQPQRLLWASTGTKNPQYRDVRYVEELIGTDTVNTIPPNTLAAFRDHGRVRSSLSDDIEQAERYLTQLQQVGISLTQITTRLLSQGVELFKDAFDQLLSTLEKKREAHLGHALNQQTIKQPLSLQQAVQSQLQQWQQGGFVRRLWSLDSSLWTGADENYWLGWLGTTEDQLAHLDQLTQLATEIREMNLQHVVLLGMGGSSLCPEVLKTTFDQVPGYPELLILDSTDPGQIQAISQKIDLQHTLFIVASKSGSTLEPNIFKDYFYEAVKTIGGIENPGDRFIAITDPQSSLETIAKQEHFRHLYHGISTIGGRYSALSNFGMVPAACMGLDLRRFLDATEVMVHSCSASVPAMDNPGVVLGVLLGAAARQGQDKLTLISSPKLSSLGAWLEQLLAESTGKERKGIIPVDLEPLGEPHVYSRDRIFAYLRLGSDPDPQQDEAIAALEDIGHSVVRIDIADIYQLGQEFFRWEIATAVAGAVLGIHAFNQPDVEASKIATRQLTTLFEEKGEFPTETPFFYEAGIKLFTDPQNLAELSAQVGSEAGLECYLKAHLDRLHPGDYCALLAYIHREDIFQSTLQQIRQAIRDQKQVATCLGFGPRFLHSTGQAYKGGPNSGVFLQITAQDDLDLMVPNHQYSFGIVKAAQAQGDFQVLAERKRRLLRVHLGPDVEVGLNTLQVAILRALQ